MATTSSGSITRKQKKELESLSGHGRGLVLKILFFAGLILFAGIVFLVIRGDGESSREHLQALNSQGDLDDWESSFLDRHAAYDQWFTIPSFSPERAVFNILSDILYKNGARISAFQGVPSVVTSTYQGIHSGLQRILFLFLMCWRLWLIGAVIATILAFDRWQKYSGLTFLSQTGNGRLFYSGIRVGLDNLNSQGIPGVQAIGLACPPAVSEQIVKQSKFAKILTRFDAQNETNLALAAIILKHPEWPAFVAARDEQATLLSSFAGALLPEKSMRVLETALEMHALYREGKDPADKNERFRAPEAHVKLTLDDHIHSLREAMHRVLTPALRKSLCALTPAQLATVVLAYEAGAVLTNNFEGGKWLRRSNFGELNARAVLHSVPAYGSDYSVEERNLIRRALVFGSRRSVFAPVHFPIDLNGETLAARQWVELLMSNPHQLQAVANEVELVSVVTEANRAFTQALFERVNNRDPEILDVTYATHSNLFLIPLSTVVKSLRLVIAEPVIRRLEILVAAVSQMQRIDNLSQDIQNEIQDKPSHVLDEKVHPPLNPQLMKELAEQHKLSAQDLRDWSALRAVLNAFGWLARRVGDYTVPESSVIYAVLKADGPNSESNHLGLIGKTGMVPFRATKLSARWGKQWGQRFKQVISAAMAENREDFERMLSGAPEPLETESIGGSAVA